jgi:hypothetical protein
MPKQPGSQQWAALNRALHTIYDPGGAPELAGALETMFERCWDFLRNPLKLPWAVRQAECRSGLRRVGAARLVQFLTRPMKYMPEPRRRR